MVLKSLSVSVFKRTSLVNILTTTWSHPSYTVISPVSGSGRSRDWVSTSTLPTSSRLTTLLGPSTGVVPWSSIDSGLLTTCTSPVTDEVGRTSPSPCTQVPPTRNTPITSTRPTRVLPATVSFTSYPIFRCTRPGHPVPTGRSPSDTPITVTPNVIRIDPSWKSWSGGWVSPSSSILDVVRNATVVLEYRIRY